MVDAFLMGEKIYLRSITLEDAGKWYLWFNDPEVITYMEKGYAPNTHNKQIEYFNHILNDKNTIQLAIIDKETSELVGGIGLHGINYYNRNGDISIIIGNKQYWHKGIGKDAVLLMTDFAFNRLNLYKVTAGMASCNDGSFKLFESCGFKEEGRLKEQVFLNGSYYDIIKMGLLSRDVKNKK